MRLFVTGDVKKYRMPRYVHVGTSSPAGRPRYERSTLGRRVFSVAGPIVWNSLPDELRDDIEYSCFRQSLKTLLSVSTSVPSAFKVYLYTTMRYINQLFTYLLTSNFGVSLQS